MIRRNDTGPSEPAWVLISQLEHARLAGALADAWAPVDRALQLPALRWTAQHHDDGWAAWEAAPQVDPDSGRPRAFTEMPLEDSLAIWSRSIEIAAAEDPLAAWLVAAHFSALLRKSSDAQLPIARAWLTHHDARRAGWLESWLRLTDDANEELAERALLWLQMFDGLSLWFCCSAREQPDQMPTPAGSLSLMPQSPERITLAPWPFVEEELSLAVTGCRVSVQAYHDAGALRAAPATAVTLHWTLQPG